MWCKNCAKEETCKIRTKDLKEGEKVIGVFNCAWAVPKVDNKTKQC